jgi:hypothetical protein
MKSFAFVALVAVAFGLGACAKDTHTPAPTPGKTVKGYKK